MQNIEMKRAQFLDQEIVEFTRWRIAKQAAIHFRGLILQTYLFTENGYLPLCAIKQSRE